MGKSQNRKKIRDAISEIGKADNYEIYSGEVVSVDEGQATIDVKINENITVFDVRLRCIINSNEGLYVIPKVNSHVVFAQIDGGQNYQLIQASAIDKVLIKIGSMTLEMSSTGFVFNDGNNHGLVKVAELTTKINNLENKVNDLITTLTAIVVPLAPSGTYPFASSFASVTALTNTTQSDIENTDIKH